MRPLLVLSPLLAIAGGVGAAGPTDPAADGALNNGAVVLMYHRFGESRYPSTNIRLSQFESHLAELKRGRHVVLPLLHVVELLRAGKPLPERSVVITIDDAYASVYTEAWPRLREAGFPFTVFVATNPVQRRFRGLMTWDELREMMATGEVAVGAHSHTHLHMAGQEPGDNATELNTSDTLIAKELGERPQVFAYPYGEFGLELRDQVAAQGYRAAFGQHSGVVHAGDDPFALPRFALNENYGALERFRTAINALPLPVQGLQPRDSLLTPAANPPHFSFYVAKAVGPLEQLSCYASHQGQLELQMGAGRQVAAKRLLPLPVGRSRINCTLPAAGGRWRWFGTQFYRPR